MTYDAKQLDRIEGVLLATAAGDALGAPYEFQPPRGPELPVGMVGGGTFGWAPGEWTDDTSMAIAIAEVAASGLDLRSTQAQDLIVARWYGWAATAADVGNQTRAVLGMAGGAARQDDNGPVGARHALWASKSHHERSGQSAGNGSLMRTAPVALAYLDDEDGLVEAAYAISALTHFEPDAGGACVLWCLAIRHAALIGELDIRRGLSRLTADRAQVWAERLDEAEKVRPADFTNNGWVVQALQAAWSAIVTTPIPADGADDPPSAHLAFALEGAVRGGYDTDTVAAIAGGLLGARWGASAIPAEWRTVLHGWPGLDADALADIASTIAHANLPESPASSGVTSI